MSEIVISMPLFIQLGKDGSKKYHLNLNNYRNWHYIVSNNLKKKYKEIAWEYIRSLKFDQRIELEFVLWKADKRRIDRANPLSVHEKFFCDALTECGCIPDDNDDYVVSTKYRTGGIDRSNPRVDVYIKEVPMEKVQFSFID